MIKDHKNTVNDKVFVVLKNGIGPNKRELFKMETLMRFKKLRLSLEPYKSAYF